MKFMVSMISDENSEMTPEEMKAMGASMGKFMGELEEAGVLADPGAPLAPSSEAQTLRYGDDGQAVVTDGPFTESKEQIAGYMILDCEDREEAVSWIRKLPVRNRSVELRALRGP